jgi:dihydropteroate synthase
MKLSCNGYQLDLNTPVVMGIINCTPDSFYSGGRAHHLDNLLETVEKMIQQGAQIIDVGGVSTRPGAALVEESEEIKRVIPVLKLLAESFPDTWFSLDTFRARVAGMGVNAGARLINDISAGSLDSDLLPIVASLKVPYVLMHMHGTPQQMQESPLDKDIVAVVSRFFSRKLEELTNLGIDQVILDPGYGFGKTTAANYVLLKNQAQLRINGLPLLTGVSRKSMINKVLNTTPEQALNGTTILNTLALLNGASILRVHDVAEAMECIRLTSFFQQTHD